MLNNIETLGLKVESIRPSANKKEVETNTKIYVKFNADVMSSTIVGNIALYEDTDGLFNGEIDTNKLTRINGNISYESKTIIFTPKNELSENKQYIVIVRKNGIKDIIGRSLLVDNVFTFFTKANKALETPTILNPKNADTIREDLIIEFTNTHNVYNVQISTNIEFDTYVVDDIVNSSNNSTVTYSPDKTLEDGLYYIRVKAMGGLFSDTVQCVIGRNIGLVSKEDYNDLLVEFDGSRVMNMLEAFPVSDKLSGVNLANIYLKFEGEITIDDINFNKSYLLGELFDETDIDDIEEAGYIDPKIITVYDKEEDVTYIVGSLV